MSNKGFTINSCDCGEIMIDFGAVKDKVREEELPDINILKNMKEDERYCPQCKRVVKIDN